MSPPSAIAMNEDAYARLPPDIRRVFDASLADAPAEVGPLWDGLDAPGKAALVQGGMEAIAHPPEAMAEFRAIGRRVGQEIIADLDRRGLPASATHQAMLAAAERFARGAVIAPAPSPGCSPPCSARRCGCSACWASR